MGKAKRYDYEMAVLGWSITDNDRGGYGNPNVRRTLRKLVREAVARSWTGYDGESAAEAADRIAKELVP